MPSARDRSTGGKRGMAPSVNQTEQLPPDPAANNPSSRAGAKVTIACKVPKGMQLKVYRFEEFPQPVMGGGTRMVKTSIQAGETVFARGPKVPEGMMAKFPVVGGYALTPNVDADFWRAWLEQNKDADYVRNRLIFAQTDAGRAQDQAAEQSEVLSNLEPMNPESKQQRVAGKLVDVPADPRAPRSMSTNLASVKADERDERAA